MALGNHAILLLFTTEADDEATAAMTVLGLILVVILIILIVLVFILLLDSLLSARHEPATLWRRHLLFRLRFRLSLLFCRLLINPGRTTHLPLLRRVTRSIILRLILGLGLGVGNESTDVSAAIHALIVIICSAATTLRHWLLLLGGSLGLLVLGILLLALHSMVLCGFHLAVKNDRTFFAGKF